MILRAKYLIDCAGRITENAEVAVEGDRIAAIRMKESSPSPADSDVVDLGSAVLLPGFVNAHTHLELTSAQPHVKRQDRFTDWIRGVVRATSGWSEETFHSSRAVGIRHSAGSGTTSVGDICRGARDVRQYLDSNMRVRLFHEVIGFDPDTADRLLDSLKARLSEFPASERLLIGIAPHTQFTVSERLLKRCIGLAHEHGWLLCIHLAETEGEVEFLRSGTGEMLEFRREFGLPPGWQPPRTSPVRYLERLGFFERPAVLVHCNYVPEEDFDIIARSGSSVVFCPRSHRYFGHRKHPFLKMLDHGINVGLGTDSLLSSPTVSMLDEMRFLRDEFPGIDAARILRMATANGVKALGLPPDAARLEQGCCADLVGVALPEKAVERLESPLEALFSKRSKVVFSVAAGKVIFDIRRSPV